MRVGTEHPALDLGEHAVNPGQHDVGLHRVDGVGIVAPAWRSRACRPAVDPGARDRSDVGLDEGVLAGPTYPLSWPETLAANYKRHHDR